MSKFNDKDYDLFASKALMFNKNELSIQNVSAAFTRVEQSFSNILTYTKNIIKLVPSLVKTPTNNVQQITPQMPVMNTDSLVSQVILVNKQVEQLANKLKALDMSAQNSSDIDIDIDRRKKKIKGGIPKAGKILGGALAAGSIAYDVYDRVSEDQSVGQIATGVTGGLLGGALGIKGGAVLSHAMGVPAPVGGLIGGALGYVGGSTLADKAYNTFIKKTDANTQKLTDNQLRSDGIIGPTEPSTQFANYLRQYTDIISKMTPLGAVAGLGGVGAIATDVAGGFMDGLSGMTPNEAVNKAMAYFQSQGWTKEQAAGIVGNLQVESGNFDPAVISGQRRGDGGKAVGIAQWHPDRQAIFRNVMKKPLIGSSLQDQLTFIQWELNNKERAAGNALRKAKTAEEAAYAVDKFYERSNGASRGQRIANAKALIRENSTAFAVGQAVGSFVVGSKNQVGAGKFIHPVKPATIGSRFGPRGKGVHKGQDYPVPMGTPVVAASNGTVTFVGNDPDGYGLYIKITHSDGTETRYAHLSRIGVRIGQAVSAGQTIGLVGSTGHSTGPHLHFEIRRNGVALDPLSMVGSGTNVPASKADSGTEPQHTTSKPQSKTMTTGEFLKEQSKSQASGKGSILIVNNKKSAGKPGNVVLPSRPAPKNIPNKNPANQYRKHFGG